MLSDLLLIIKMMVYTHWTAPQSIDPTGFLPIDPMPRTFPRGDDMGRKAGMACFSEPDGCLDCFVPRKSLDSTLVNDAKRQWGRSQERVQRKVFCVGMPNLVRVGRAGHGRHGGGAPALCGGPLMSALTLWSFPVKRKGQESGRLRKA